MSNSLEFWLFLPQMRMSMETLVERAQVAETAGFGGIAGMDHLAPPGGESSPMFESLVTCAWLAGRTDRLRVGSLVLCDSFRHPAVLAREAVTIDHASGGRFELGLGWGSVPRELGTFGFGSPSADARLRRLEESLEIITSLWRGETFDYDGRYFTLRAAQQQPTPVRHIPIVIGGTGSKTMKLVASYADWWNVHSGVLDRFEQMRPLAGSARPSLQIQIAFVPSEQARQQVEQTAHRRFGDRPVIANSGQLVDYFSTLEARGVERAYVWFTDFAPPDTLLAFGETVIDALSRS
jgi:alkanesulfonate monooxygenase SsuD/methylene tetrahydromethanopterin reductase-like flavin-dependent oxidoreductase (luciferase family)